MSADVIKQCIAVFDGQLVNPFTVTHRDGVFRVETIAHALSLDNRYGGHTSDAHGGPIGYSVAEHCLLVEHIVDCRLLCGPWSPAKRLALRREALVHDATEAYLRDMLAPVKHDASMSAYRDVESRLDVELRLWFGVPVIESQFVKDIDIELRGTEVRQLFRETPAEWEAILAPPIPGIQCGTMMPWQAKRAWLAKFRELWPGFVE